MYDNYNYPAGADTPDAPWNQPGDPEPMTIMVKATTLLSHNTTIETDNYDICQDDEWKGKSIVLYDNASDVEKYYKEQHRTIPNLLGELAKYIKGELAGDISKDRKRELKSMLDDCKGWEVNDLQVEDYGY